MGRLMDSVMAAVGLKPSDRVTITHGPLDPSNLKPAQADTASDKPDKQISIPDTATGQPTVNLNNLPTESTIEQSTRPIQMENSPTHLADKVGEMPQEDVTINAIKTPVERKDCFGCRVTGLILGPATSAFILHAIYTRRHLYKGAARYGYYAQGLLLSTAFITLGVCRFFEVSIFDPNKAEMSLGDHFKDELKTIGVPVKVDK